MRIIDKTQDQIFPVDNPPHICVRPVDPSSSFLPGFLASVQYLYTPSSFVQFLINVRIFFIHLYTEATLHWSTVNDAAVKFAYTYFCRCHVLPQPFFNERLRARSRAAHLQLALHFDDCDFNWSYLMLCFSMLRLDADSHVTQKWLLAANNRDKLSGICDDFQVLLKNVSPNIRWQPSVQLWILLITRVDWLTDWLLKGLRRWDVFNSAASINYRYLTEIQSY